MRAIEGQLCVGLDPCVGLDTVADVRVKGAIGVVELTEPTRQGRRRVPVAGRLAPALRDAALHDRPSRVPRRTSRVCEAVCVCRGERGD